MKKKWFRLFPPHLVLPVDEEIPNLPKNGIRQLLQLQQDVPGIKIKNNENGLKTSLVKAGQNRLMSRGTVGDAEMWATSASASASVSVSKKPERYRRLSVRCRFCVASSTGSHLKRHFVCVDVT